MREHVDQEPISRCLSAVMPCYNEAATVVRAVERVLAQPFIGQLVVVDDKSTDGSADLLDGIDDERLVVVRHAVNKGKGAALRTGFALATMPFVTVQDADLEYDPTDLAQLLRPLLNGDADVVYGSRFMTSDAHRVLYFWHSVGNRLLTLASNMVTNLNLTDMETCYKVFRKDVLERITIEEDRFGVEPELTAKVAALQCRIYEVGISYHGRSYAEGKKVGWRDGFEAFAALAKYTIRGRGLARRSRRAPIMVDEADEQLSSVLEELDSATKYAEWIMSLLRPHLRGRVLEVGAGHGTFSRLLADNTAHLVASEPSSRAFAVLSDRLADRADVEVVHGGVDELATWGPFDAVVLVNVLEHIEAHDKALDAIADMLASGGRVCLYVPAFEALYSKFDRAVGHCRRYRKAELEALVGRAGLTVVESHYVNSAGFFAWLLTARALSMTPTQHGLADLYDRAVVPGLARLERSWRPPFGQSLFVVAERAASPDDLAGRSHADHALV